MKKPNHFDAVHAASYEQYVEEIVLRGLGDVACETNPLSSVFTVEKLPQHDKNDSVYEEVREWNELNEAIEELNEIFDRSPIALPLISHFERTNVVDFRLLRQKFELMRVSDFEPVILITPHFSDNNIKFFIELARDNDIKIKDPYNFLSSIEGLDYEYFWSHRHFQRAVFREVKASSCYWTVSIICGSTSNILSPSGLRSGSFDSNKALWHEYVLAQILLARRGATLLDTKKATYSNQTKPHNLLQADDMAMYFSCFNPNNHSIEITKIRREKVAKSTANLRIKIVITAPGSGDIS